MGEIDDDGDERQAGSFVGSKLLYLAGFAACIAVTAHSYLPFSLSVSIIPRLTPNGTKNQAMTDTTDEELWLPAKGALILFPSDHSLRLVVRKAPQIPLKSLNEALPFCPFCRHPHLHSFFSSLQASTLSLISPGVTLKLSTMKFL